MSQDISYSEDRNEQFEKDEGEASVDISDEFRQDSNNARSDSNSKYLSLSSSNLVFEENWASNWVLCLHCFKNFVYGQLRLLKDCGDYKQ